MVCWHIVGSNKVCGLVGGPVSDCTTRAMALQLLIHLADDGVYHHDYDDCDADRGLCGNDYWSKITFRSVVLLSLKSALLLGSGQAETCSGGGECLVPCSHRHLCLAEPFS